LALILIINNYIISNHKPFSLYLTLPHTSVSVMSLTR